MATIFPWRISGPNVAGFSIWEPGGSATPSQRSLIYPYTRTHGRSDFSSSVIFETLTFSVVMDLIEQEAATVGVKVAQVLSIGNVVYATRTTGSGGITDFKCRITDVSSNGQTFTVNAVSSAAWELSNTASTAYSFPAQIPATSISTIVAGVGLNIQNNTTVTAYQAAATAETTTNALSLINTLAQAHPSLVVDTRLNGTGVASTSVKLWDRFLPLPAASHTFTDDDILYGYSFARSIADVANQARVSYSSGSIFTVSNQTSIASVGVRSIDIDANSNGQASAEAVGTYNLGLRALYGFPIYELGISFDYATEIEFNDVIDVSAVTTYGLADVKTLYVEQVTKTYNATSTQIRIIASDTQFSAMAQRWNDVTPTLTWAATPSTLTWDDLLFTNI